MRRDKPDGRAGEEGWREHASDRSGANAQGGCEEPQPKYQGDTCQNFVSFEYIHECQIAVTPDDCAG
jgi:hypothetical protein